MRYLFGVMVLVLMALPLAWFYVAMFWGFTVSKDIAAFERGEDVLLPTAAPLRWLDDRTELRDAFTLDEITPARYIATRIELPFAEMLNPGEAMPKRELKELMPRCVRQLCSPHYATRSSAIWRPPAMSGVSKAKYVTPATGRGLGARRSARRMVKRSCMAACVTCPLTRWGIRRSCPMATWSQPGWICWTKDMSTIRRKGGGNCSPVRWPSAAVFGCALATA